jgi:hypothetical protein
MEMAPIGKMLVLLGGVIVGVGILLIFFDKIPYIGKLPGDISIKKDNFQFYFPLTTSILISIVLSLILWLFSHWKGK